MMPYSGRASHAPILEHVPIRTYRIAHKTVRDRSWTVSLCSPSFMYGALMTRAGIGLTLGNGLVYSH